MTIRCGIIDDDALAISILQSYIDKMPDTSLVISSQHALEARPEIAKNDIDLLFLDIEMPEITGLDFLQTLTAPPKIIITSAKKDYAAKGFELDVLDYIVKPVTFQRFVASIKKYNTQAKVTKAQTPKPTEFIFLKENKKMVKVYINNILYVESIKDYIRVVTKKKTVITKEQISNFSEKVPALQFIRVHRSFLVAKKHIDAYSSNIIEIGGKEISIGRNYKEACLKKLAE